MDDESGSPALTKSTLRRGCITVANFAKKTVILTAEIAVAAFLGATVGNHLNNKSITADCARVNMAKVGDVYVRCAIVEPPKNQPQ